MNEYTVEFFARCPVNGLRIKYELRIERPGDSVLKVEDILAVVDAETREPAYHEDLADRLHRSLGGVRQTLEAEHHGVRIVTRRGAP